MNQSNEQAFLHFLRSSTPSLNEYTSEQSEYIREQLNVIADSREKHGVQSASELQQKLATSQKESTTKEAEGFKEKREPKEVIQKSEPDQEDRTNNDLPKAKEARSKGVSKCSSSQVDASNLENNPRNDGGLDATVTNDLSQTDQTQETLSPSTDNSSQEEIASVIDDYVRRAIQLRDEKSYELTDENISKIVELAKKIKKAYKVEGLKSFMSSLGIKTTGVKNGELLNKIVYHFEDVALMRFKAVRMQEMK